MGGDFREKEGVNVRFDMDTFAEDDMRDEIENRNGCYIISSPTHQFEYPNGKSSIIYIGKSDKLYRRLYLEHYQKHLKKLRENKDFGIYEKSVLMVPSRYQYMRKWGARVDVFYCKGKQESKEFESLLIASFYNKYRAIPIGNGARSFSNK